MAETATAVAGISAEHGGAPFYLPTGDEVELFRAAYARRIPLLLKGPTGCGKTRFVEHMAWHLAQVHRRPPARRWSR